MCSSRPVQRLANVHWLSHVSTPLLTAYSVMDASWCPLLCESQIFTHYARSLKDIHIPQGQTSLSSIFQSFSFQTPDQPIRIFPLLMSMSSFSPQTPAPSTQKEKEVHHSELCPLGQFFLTTVFKPPPTLRVIKPLPVFNFHPHTKLTCQIEHIQALLTPSAGYMSPPQSRGII